MKKVTILFSFLAFNGFGLQAQSVADYVFSQSTETYTPVVGTPSTAAGDDGSQNDIPIGFDFSYGSATYTTFSISTNGFIRLGNPVAGSSWTNILANNAAQRPLIAAFWDDHNRNTGSIQYALSGSTPDQILEIGWDNINLGGNGSQSATAFGSFKMRLYETTGVIEFIYGPTMNPVGNLSASVGLNDSGSFLSITPNLISATASNITANNLINSTEFLVGQKFTFTLGPPCNGVPVPGNTVSSVSSVCAGTNFQLSLENPTAGFGVSYQWQSSFDGVEYSDIPLANNSILTTNQTLANYYQCLVSCGSESAISTPVQVTVNSAILCFCTPTYTIGKTDGDLISNVTITGTTLSNSSGTEPVNPAYTYFTGQENYTASLQMGYTYELNVTVGSFGQQNVTAWIDYNDNGFFEANERVGSTAEIGGGGTGTFQITLDCNALPGLHRMRIRDVWNTLATNIDPCANYQYGETEDYDITIEEGSICIAPTNLGTSSLNATNATLTWVSVCNPLGSDLHFGPAGSGLPTGLPSHPNSTSPLLISDLTNGTSYEFYVRSVCVDNQYSNWIGPYTFTTLPPPIANDECINAIELTAGTTFAEHAVIASNLDASTSIGIPNPTCAALGFGGDVWFSTIVPADGKITIELQANPGSPFIDSGMSVFTGSCDNLTAIGCSDDEGVGSFSKLNLTGLTAGQTIYARVWEYGNNVQGTFKIAAWSATLNNNNFDFSDLNYYPNPVYDYLSISNKQPITAVLVYNLLGQQVINQTVLTTSANINLSNIPTGTYLVKVFVNDKTKTFKISKE